MARHCKTTKYNLINVPEGFIDRRGYYLGSITLTGLDSPAKKLRFWASRYNEGKLQYPKAFIAYNDAKQFLIDGKV